MKNIAIFASGSGSNAENIIKYFANSSDVNVALVATNKSDAYVIERAQRLGVPTYIFNKATLSSSTEVLDELKRYSIDYVVLAGFLLLVPPFIIHEYAGKIVNIHPALLPNYGGAGMYGDRVHKAVKEAGEEFTGITIHNVNEKFDDGDIIFQAKCDVAEQDTPDDIASKVHALEYEHFPRVIEEHIAKVFVN